MKEKSQIRPLGPSQKAARICYYLFVFGILPAAILMGTKAQDGIIGFLAVVLIGAVVFVLPTFVLVWAYEKVRLTSRMRASAKAAPDHDPANDKYFEVAGSEIVTGNLKPATWAKSLASTNGNESKAKAAYVKLRVRELADSEPIPEEDAVRDAAATLELKSNATTAERRGGGEHVDEPRRKPSGLVLQSPQTMAAAPRRTCFLPVVTVPAALLIFIAIIISALYFLQASLREPSSSSQAPAMDPTAFANFTATRSNASFFAVLPHISDFAKKIDLQIALPITPVQVEHFFASPFPHMVGEDLYLTNGYWFSCRWHHLRNKKVPLRSEDIEPVSIEFGIAHMADYVELPPSKMTTNEIITLARQTLVKLGYIPEIIHADAAPELQSPAEAKDAGHTPYCEVKWVPEGKRDSAGFSEICVSVNTRDKSVVGLYLGFCSHIRARLGRPPPVAWARSESEADFRREAKPTLYFDTNAPPGQPGSTNGK